MTVGRFAPSPTGDLHLGSALAALAAWASARSAGGRFVWRVEDLDGPRAVPEAAERQMEDARWLGLDWDEGPDVGGPHGPYRQSERSNVYDAALRRLAEADRLFPCRVSRKDLLALASAPHGAEGLPPYPASLRPDRLGENWFDTETDCAFRFRIDPEEVAFEDRVIGRVEEDASAAVGDIVLKRRDGVYAYQLAVVVDDLAMGVTEVVRGADLLGSTARQILLTRALGGTPPTHAHVPLLVAADGRKLSKREGDLSLRSLRDAGARPEAVVAWLAATLGQTGRTPAEMAAAFDVSRVPTEAVPVPADLADRLGG
ncbi:MAG: tRNA glutamyl-Q(34) synthetase GluQRS [Bacteroidota bacterium]